MARQYLEQINPADLKPMPRNKHVFGDVNQGLEPLAEAIKSRGMLAPIIVTAKRFIADGHRRHAAALLLKLDKVPCFVSERDSVEDAMEDWRICQLTQRKQTPEQMARLAEEKLLLINSLPESKDEKTSGLINPAQESPKTQGKPAKSKHDLQEEAAKEAGFGSRTTALKAAKVASAITELEEQGETGLAEELRTTLNEESVHAASQKLREIQPPPVKPPKDETLDEVGKKIPEHLLPTFATRQLFKDVLKASKELKAAFAELCDEKHDEHTHKLNKTQARNDLKNFLQSVTHAIPHAVCPYCKGSGQAKGAGCQPCKGAGWLVKSAYTSIPDDVK